MYFSQFLLVAEMLKLLYMYGHILEICQSVYSVLNDHCSDNVQAWSPYSRYRSLSAVDGLSRSLEFLGLWESLPVVGSLSGSFMVVNCLSKSSFKLLLLAPKYSLPVVGSDHQGRSLAVAKGILFRFHMTQMT